MLTKVHTLGSQIKPWSSAYIGEIRIADGGGD